MNVMILTEDKANKPLEKCATDMTEIKTLDGKLYISVIFDCFDLTVLGLAMDTNMKTSHEQSEWMTLSAK